MNKLQFFVRALLFCTMLGTGLMAFARPALAASVQPVFIGGNVTTCVNINGVTYDHSYSTGIAPVSGQQYALGGGHYVVFTLSPVGGNLTASVAFQSTLPLSAVIIKGGNDANAYIYPTPVTADSGLISPPVGQQGNTPNVSHVVVCWDNQPLKAAKDAAGSYDRTIDWKLEKTVAPASHVGFMGDTFDSTWTVGVTKTETIDNYQVNGKITITNPNTIPVNFSVTDTLNDGTSANVTCPSATVAAGGTIVCTYTAKPAGTSATQNNAAITSLTPDVGGTTASAPVAFTENVIGDDKLTLKDERFNYAEEITGNKTKTFNETFECPVDPSKYTNGKLEFPVINTAALKKGETTVLSKDATVTVTCYAVSVYKTAETSFTRTWTWGIDKSGDQSALTLQPGQTYVVNYEVDVTANAPTDGAWQVTGVIEVHNPAPESAPLTGVTDVITKAGSADIPVTVACTLEGSNAVITFPYLLPAGATLVCPYSQALPDGTARTNTAAATLQNYDNDVASGTTNVTYSAAVSFSQDTDNKVDECINVSDDKYGDLGQVCAADSPETFYYSLTVGPYSAEQCGTTQAYVNNASFVTVDTQATGSDSHTVNVTVSCSCTLTQGYWKTHSSKGPAPYDDTWAKLSAGADTPFINTDKTYFNKTYYQVLWTPPAGNPYYQLAHQYIAAQLNILNGSSVPADVQAAYNEATTLLQNTAKPDAVAALKGNDALRKKFVSLAGTLASYNEGKIGPGHCSEDASSNVTLSVTGLDQSRDETLFMPMMIRQ